MKKIAIVATAENEFFIRSKRLAALADAGKLIPDDSIISGDPADLLKELTPARLALMSVVKASPIKVNTHESLIWSFRTEVAQKPIRLQVEEARHDAAVGRRCAVFKGMPMRRICRINVLLTCSCVTVLPIDAKCKLNGLKLFEMIMRAWHVIQKSLRYHLNAEPTLTPIYF